MSGVAVPPADGRARGDSAQGGERATTRWLLDGGCQLPSGPHAGGVGGVVAADRVAYVYPEITGYYLQWLAWRAGDDAGGRALAGRAQSAQRWLAHWLGHDPPPTRVHLAEGVADWRNDASFFFDTAMALRGVAAAAGAGLLNPAPATVDGLCRLLDHLVGADGEFDAAAVHRPGAGVPDRWSTRRGAFLAKAAAGVLVAGQVLDVPERLCAAAERTLNTSLRALGAGGHREIHPLLYAAEGFLSMPEHPLFVVALPVVVARFDALLASVRLLGRVAEFVDATAAEPGTRRVDILAQLLRLGALLAAYRPMAPGDRQLLDHCRRELAAAITAAGSLPFVLGEAPPRHNTWATMFADQALAITGNDGDAGALRRTAQLVV